MNLTNSYENYIGGSLALNVVFPVRFRSGHQFLYLAVCMLYLDYWKGIKNCENKYSGSYWGNVRSLNRVVNDNGGKRFVKGRILKPSLSSGYLRLDICANNKQTTKTVHRLIAETFIKNPNNYPHINHKNGIKTDNRVENLEWCTASYNILHAFKNGLSSKRGEKNSHSKLTEKQVIEIKAKLLQGQKNVDLAKEYGVNPVTISMIKTGRSWGHV